MINPNRLKTRKKGQRDALPSARKSYSLLDGNSTTDTLKVLAPLLILVSTASCNATTGDTRMFARLAAFNNFYGQVPVDQEDEPTENSDQEETCVDEIE